MVANGERLIAIPEPGDGMRSMKVQRAVAKYSILSLACLLLASPLHAQSLQRDSLLSHLIGRWVLRGTMRGKDVVHDVTFAWVLGGEYVEMHEVSRERTPGGSHAYEAIVYLVRDPHTHEYAAQWLDKLAATTHAAALIAHEMVSSDHEPCDDGAAMITGIQTSTVKTVSIAASIAAARRGSTPSRMPSAAARCAVPVRYAQPV
jgi:hypothetical protein